ncbi:MAG: glycosyltransferase family 4 protein [Candidatus Omnitrophica bacterium]|nr:glycosyltransferase family 4 protein [Candidatus Omnitrophota bacterium]
MKILFVANRSEIFSGGQISLLELLSGLDRSKYEPIVLCPGEGGMSESIRALGIPVSVWEMPTARTLNVFHIWKKARELKVLIHRSEADIVHANGNRAQFYASLAARGTKASLLWHVREAEKDLFLYDWFLASSAEKIICVSEVAADIRFKHLPGIQRKVINVYNGVNTSKFYRDEAGRNSVRQEFGIKGNNIFIGIIGLLVPRKGHLFLIKAIKRLSREYPGIRLLIAGKTVNPGYTESLRRAAREEKCEDNIIFAGERTDIRAILSALDIFVLPSRREGFSRVLLEAMACSVPIVATNITGNSEAVVDGESGLLVPFMDVKAMENAIKHLIKDKDHARKMGENARIRVEKFFTLDKHVEDMQQLYKTVRRNQCA